MMTLYEVNIRVMVVAEDNDEAIYEASHAASDPSACEVEAHEALSVPYGWADAIPFGSSDDLTCREWLKK